MSKDQSDQQSNPSGEREPDGGALSGGFTGSESVGPSCDLGETDEVSEPDVGHVDANAYFSRPVVAVRRPPVIRLMSNRALGLFVIRESDKWDNDLFNTLRDRTYLTHRSLIPVEAVRKVGMVPLTADTFTITDEDGKTQKIIFVEKLHHGATTAVLFHYRGYWHLWAQASAALVDSATGANDFTEILVTVLERLQPKTVYAANISRLVRSVRQVAPISTAMIEYVDELVVGEFVFSFTGPNSAVSVMMLNMLAWSAAMERDAIVTRTLAGRIAKWRRREWVFGEGTIPFGLRINALGQLEPDPKKKATVREMLIILSTDLPPEEMVRQLSAVGVTGMRKSRRLKQEAPLGVTRSAHQTIRSLYSWAPIWVSGEYLLRHTNPFPALSEIAGLPIVRKTDDGTPLGTPELGDDGEIQMLFKVGTPAGGWAEAEVLAAFANRARDYNAALVEAGRTPNRPLADSVMETSELPGLLAAILPQQSAAGNDKAGTSRRDAARARKKLSALTGRNWQSAGEFFELQATTSSLVRLVRWSKDPDIESSTTDPRRHAGRRPVRPNRKVSSTITADNDESQVVGYFDTRKVMRGFVAAAGEALRTGVPVSRMPGTTMFNVADTVTVSTDADMAAYWRHRVEDANAAIKRATRLSMNADIDDEQAEDYAAEAKRQRALKAAAQAQLDALELATNSSGPVLPNSPLEVSTLVWLPALQRLAQGADSLTQAEYRAFNTIVPRLWLDRRQGVWWGNAIVRVNTKEGVAELGPIQWRIGRGGVSSNTLTASTQLRKTDGDSRRRQKRLLTDSGKVSELAASTIVNANFPELTTVLMHSVLGTPWPDWVSGDWRDPAFVAWIDRVYTDPDFAWLGNGKWGQVCYLRQLIADQVCEAPDGTLSMLDLNRLVNGYPQSAVVAMHSRPKEGRIRLWNPPTSWEANRSVPVADRRLERRRCGQEGRGATSESHSIVIARVPEVATDLLCTCGRMIDAQQVGVPSDLVFPSAYQELRIPADEALEACIDEYGGFDNATAEAKRIFALTDLLSTGATQLEIARALDARKNRTSARSSVPTTALQHLRLLGLVTSSQTRPAIWTYTEEGMTKLEELQVS